MQKKRKFQTILWIVLPLATMLFALCVGRLGLTIEQVISSLLAGPSAADSDTAAMAVYNVRLPRIVLAWLVGSGLAVSGCCFQSVFSNPLASPDTLGVSSGAAFGAALGILLSLSITGTQFFAIGFGILAIAATFLLSRMKSDGGILMVVLAGVIASSFFNALISAVKYLADPLTKLPEITYWLMGSMLGASYHDLTIALPLIGIPMFLLFFLRWRLNVLTLSDEEAISLGVHPRRMRWFVIVLCTIIIAACVSVCGQVGWVGLVIPHMARRIVGADHRYVVPACISLGGVYLLLIDTLARTLTSGEFPLSILTAIIGLPIFVILFFRRGAVGFAS